MFSRIVHADWSKHPGGRWCATARRVKGGWRAAGPWPVGDVAAVVDRLLAFGRSSPTLAAFDLPIGLPERYAAKTGLPDFRTALAAFGGPGWTHWFVPAATPAEIGIARPFYPDRPGSARQAHLVDALGAARFGALMRGCEIGPPDAGCMFWLVGAKTVGKAAIHGWQAAIRPALAQGARLWPFDGDLARLAAEGGLVLAESYPGDACGQLGLKVVGKGDPAVLKPLGPALRAWTAARRIALSGALRGDIESGFARHGQHTGDAFDAVVGLLAAIAVAEGERPDGAPATPTVRTWEGWILGRASAGIHGAAGAFRAGGETWPTASPARDGLRLRSTSMRNLLTPAALALALGGAAPALGGTAPALAQTAKPPVVPAPAPVPPAAAQAQAGQAADSVRQVQLSQASIDHYLAAKKDMDTALDALPEGADQPDPATLKKLDGIAQAHMFTDYKDYDATENTIGMVMAGIDPDTKAYIGPEAVIDKQIAQVQGDKQIAAKEKKDTVDQLKASKATIPKLQFPSDVDLVVKNYDKLNAAMPQD